jgi:hypothetical protein
VPHVTITNTSPTIEEFRELRDRVTALEERQEPDEFNDPAFCPECESAMTLVRPGKHQCDVCPKITQAHRAGALWMRAGAAAVVLKSKVPGAVKLAADILDIDVE